MDAGVKWVRGKPVITDAAEVIRAFRANRNDAQDRKAGSVSAGKPNSLVTAEIRLKEARTRRVEQEMDVRAGKTFLRADVRRAQYEVGKTIRENLDNIPTRLCGQLAVETDPEVCRALLAAEIRRALEVLADILEEVAS